VPTTVPSAIMGELMKIPIKKSTPVSALFWSIIWPIPMRNGEAKLLLVAAMIGSFFNY